MYVIYTILGICGIDWNLMGCIFHISIVAALNLLISSLLFHFCYVHRLPIYYIIINEIITGIDYYLHIPISTFNICIIHIILILCLIYGYSYYYIKYVIISRIKNRNKNKTINNLITKLNTEFIDKKLFISFIGKEFEGNPKYLWNIKIGSKEVNVTSKKSIIALSKSNTTKYLDNVGKTFIILQVGDYKSPTFLI